MSKLPHATAVPGRVVGASLRENDGRLQAFQASRVDSSDEATAGWLEPSRRVWQHAKAGPG
jgi:hypothetical protein